MKSIADEVTKILEERNALRKFIELSLKEQPD
jgi:hypothetical protein